MKPKTQKIYPKPGKMVIDPETKREIPQDGKIVVWSSFWIKRMADGDITLDPIKPVESSESLDLEKPKKKKKIKKSDEPKVEDVKKDHETLKPQENEK